MGDNLIMRHQQDDFPACILPGRAERVTELEPAAIAALLRAHGAVLFRGFLPDESAFEELTEEFSTRFLVDEGVTRGLVPHRQAATQRVVAPQPQRPFGLHAELASSTPQRPHLLWLYCVHPPSEGGATLLCDGAALYRALSPPTRRLFAGAWVRHRGRAPVPALMRSPYALEPAFANALVGRSTYAAIQRLVTWADGQPLPQAAWEEARQCAVELTVSVRWQSGDVVMIDNLRCMHGRTSFPPADPRTLYSRVAWDLHPRFYA